MAATTAGVRSFVPTELPPEIEHGVGRAERVSHRRPDHVFAIGQHAEVDRLPPAALMSARSAYWLTFRTCPARA